MNHHHLPNFLIVHIFLLQQFYYFQALQISANDNLLRSNENSSTVLVGLIDIVPRVPCILFENCSKVLSGLGKHPVETNDFAIPSLKDFSVNCFSNKIIMA